MKKENKEEEKKNCGCNEGKSCMCKDKAGDTECKCVCQECEKNIEIAKRTMADFVNYKRRSEDIVAVTKQISIVENSLKFLPSVDAINLACKIITDEASKKGMMQVKADIEKILADIGIKKMNCLNEEFNPDFHNAVISEEKEGVKAGIITEILQDGYILGDKVVRYAMVKVSK